MQFKYFLKYQQVPFEFYLLHIQSEIAHVFFVISLSQVKPVKQLYKSEEGEGSSGETCSYLRGELSGNLS